MSFYLTRAELEELLSDHFCQPEMVISDYFTSQVKKLFF